MYRAMVTVCKLMHELKLIMTKSWTAVRPMQDTASHSVTKNLCLALRMASQHKQKSGLSQPFTKRTEVTDLI